MIEESEGVHVVARRINTQLSTKYYTIYEPVKMLAKGVFTVAAVGVTKKNWNIEKGDFLQFHKDSGWFLGGVKQEGKSPQLFVWLENGNVKLLGVRGIEQFKSDNAPPMPSNGTELAKQSIESQLRQLIPKKRQGTSRGKKVVKVEVKTETDVDEVESSHETESEELVDDLTQKRAAKSGKRKPVGKPSRKQPKRAAKTKALQSGKVKGPAGQVKAKVKAVNLETKIADLESQIAELKKAHSHEHLQSQQAEFESLKALHKQMIEEFRHSSEGDWRQLKLSMEELSKVFAKHARKQQETTSPVPARPPTPATFQASYLPATLPFMQPPPFPAPQTNQAYQSYQPGQPYHQLQSYPPPSQPYPGNPPYPYQPSSPQPYPAPIIMPIIMPSPKAGRKPGYFMTEPE